MQTYFDIFNNIDNINVTAMVLSGITIIVLVFNNEFLKVKKKTTTDDLDFEIEIQ